MTYKLAVLDDYLGCARTLADWGRLGPEVEVTIFDAPIAEQDRARVLADFDILCLMRDRMPLRAGLVAQLPRLKFVSYTGPSNLVMDGEAVLERGIAVSNTGAPNGLNEHFEFIWALIMATMREIPRNDAAMRAGHWQSGAGRSLHGRTIGIFGLGNFGRMVANMATVFGMNVLAWSHNLTSEKAAAAGATYAGFEELLARSDVVSIHLQLSERTRGLIDAAALGTMKRDAVLINTSRGPIVDEAALVRALQDGVIARAGLDVFDIEPLPEDHILRSLPNVVLSPHMGFSTEELLGHFHRQSLENVEAWLAGDPIRVADADIIAGRRHGPG